MILIRRTPPPSWLAKLEQEELKRVRLVAQKDTEALATKYKDARKSLYAMQFSKCCYCEADVTEPEYNEHFRPKSKYWWLTWSWDNLLFACPQCNRSNKKAKFPLQTDTSMLVAEERPPQNEIPLLLDPTGQINPLDHIEFLPFRDRGSAQRWRPHPKNRSPSVPSRFGN